MGQKEAKGPLGLFLREQGGRRYKTRPLLMIKKSLWDATKGRSVTSEGLCRAETARVLKTIKKVKAADLRFLEKV